MAALTEVFCRDAKHASVAVGVRIVAGNAGELVVGERKRFYLHGRNNADLVFCWRRSFRVAFAAEFGKRFFKEQCSLAHLVGAMAGRTVLLDRRQPERLRLRRSRCGNSCACRSAQEKQKKQADAA